jgi:hypothetical protein
MEYLLVKWVHIVSSTILFGTGIGSAFCLFMANRSKEVPSIYFATLIEPRLADFPHPALGQDITPSPTARRAQAGTGVRDRSTRKGAGVGGVSASNRRRVHRQRYGQVSNVE